jgi:hypothetical protein
MGKLRRRHAKTRDESSARRQSRNDDKVDADVLCGGEADMDKRMFGIKCEFCAIRKRDGGVLKIDNETKAILN